MHVTKCWSQGGCPHHFLPKIVPNYCLNSMGRLFEAGGKGLVLVLVKVLTTPYSPKFLKASNFTHETTFLLASPSCTLASWCTTCLDSRSLPVDLHISFLCFPVIHLLMSSFHQDGSSSCEVGQPRSHSRHCRGKRECFHTEDVCASKEKVRSLVNVTVFVA